MPLKISDQVIRTTIDSALKKHYRLSMETQKVPSDYLLMFTEGGEADAIARAIIDIYDKAIPNKEAKTVKLIEKSFVHSDSWANTRIIGSFKKWLSIRSFILGVTNVNKNSK